MKFVLWIIVIIIIIVMIYFLGPKPAKLALSGKIKESLTSDLTELENEISQAESSRLNIKEDNQARIVWYDSTQKEKTPYSVVYLHGFSASCGEGYPVNVDFVRRYGCNMYLSRLCGHGIDTPDALLDLTPENYLESAKHAVNIGRQLGEKVILMSTSTGGTLSLAIAAENPWINALILYSPNIDVVDKSTNIFLKPWGIQIAKIFKGKYNEYNDPPEVQKYWQSKYRLEAVQAMKVLVDGYYYKNEQKKDPTVSVERMLEMFDRVSTPESKKWKVAFPDAGCHPIASGIYNKDVKSVEKKTYKFAEKVLEMKPVSE